MVWRQSRLGLTAERRARLVVGADKDGESPDASGRVPRDNTAHDGSHKAKEEIDHERPHRVRRQAGVVRVYGVIEDSLTPFVDAI